MQEFLATALSAPTVVFTLLLGVVLVYWVTVMLGALDIHVLEPGGALDGADGALDAADGALDGGDGALDGADGAHDASEGSLGGIAGVLAALRLRHAPLTVVLSVMILLGWLASYFGSRYLAPVLPFSGWLAALVVGLAALLVAMPLTSLLTRPLAPLFATHAAPGNAELIGKLATVRTGRVDAKFGQAEVRDGQSSLLVHVRCENPDALARGDQALIIGWDEKNNSFEVEPLEELLPESRRER